MLSTARQTGGRILCVEDNYLGGLSGAVAEAAAATGGIKVFQHDLPEGPQERPDHG